MELLQACFERVLQMSLTAGWVILAVLLARLLLRKAPRRCTYWLWLVVLFRLLCPVSVQSPVSLVPAAVRQAELPSAAAPELLPDGTLSVLPDAQTAADRVVVSPGHAQRVPAAVPDVPQPEASRSPQPAAVAALVWAAGLAALAGYTFCSLLRLRRGLQLAVPLEPYEADGLPNVYELRMAQSPFVCGLLNPAVYLPAHLTAGQAEHILAHERTHLRRGDHWVKMLWWLAVCLHWFNPLVWVGFLLLERDMELSCDELAVRGYTPAQKKAYSLTLLELAAPRRPVGGCPLAFGESNIKTRIRRLLDPRQPALWLVAATAVLVAVLVLVLGADPIADSGDGPEASFSTASSAASSQAEAPQIKWQGTSLYRDFFLGVLYGRLPECLDGASIDWEAYRTALSAAGYTVHEDEGVFDVFDPEAPDWMLCGSLANDPNHETKVVVSHLCYLSPGEKLWYNAGVSAYCFNLRSPAYTLDFNPLSSQAHPVVYTAEEVEAYFAQVFAEQGLQLVAPAKLNGRYLRPGWNTFEGCGVLFAVNEEWISPEQDDQQPQSFPFVHGARTLFTYEWAEARGVPAPLTREEVHARYQKVEHEILILSEYPIAGQTGTKLVVYLPGQDRVVLQYTVTVPNCLWYTDAMGTVVSMVDVTQTFTFESTHAQWAETELLADRVAASAQLNTTLKVDEREPDRAFVANAMAAADAAVTVEQAVAIAKRQAEANGFETDAGECTVVTESGRYYGTACWSVALTCRVRSAPDELPAGWWRGYVDCATGELLWYDCTK